MVTDHNFRTILIGGEPARRAAFKIGEFDYLCGLPFSVKGFVNPNLSQNYSLVNCGREWHDVPIYRDLQYPVTNDQAINSAGIYFNAKHVLYWVREVIKYPQVKNVVIFAEDVPEKDQREICHLSLVTGTNIIGPSSTGMLVAGEGRLGEIGGDWNNLNLCHLDKQGDVGIITKSGTISGELLWVVSQNSKGVHTAVQVGGDPFPATDFVWWLERYAANPEIKTVVMAGEAGGDLEERAANYIEERRKKKEESQKIIAVISGKFLEQMPKGQKFGHAGAKQEESGFGSAAHKIEVLRKASVEIVEFEDLGARLRDLADDTGCR